MRVTLNTFLANAGVRMGRGEEGQIVGQGCARTLERGGVLGEAGGVGDPGGAGVRRLRRRSPWRRAVVGRGRRRCLCRRHGAASSSSSSPLSLLGFRLAVVFLDEMDRALVMGCLSSHS